MNLFIDRKLIFLHRIIFLNSYFALILPGRFNSCASDSKLCQQQYKFALPILFDHINSMTEYCSRSFTNEVILKRKFFSQ